jgi:hypothetical protein
MLITPGGISASRNISQSKNADMEVNSEGFATAVHPKARHGAIFQVSKYKGMFHGEMSANTPVGERCS